MKATAEKYNVVRLVVMAREINRFKGNNKADL